MAKQTKTTLPKRTKAEEALLVEKYGEAFPQEMGKCADVLWELDQERKALQRQADDIEARQVKLRQYIIDTLPMSAATGVTGKLAKVTIQIKEIPQGKDWDAFYKFLIKEKKPELLQKRLSSLVGEMLEEGVNVPGVEIFRNKVVSLTKA